MPPSARKSTKKPKKPIKLGNSAIFRFIDFFVRTGEKISGTKPLIIRGKDGHLISLALKRLPVEKLETLSVWFLANKKNLRPLIGTMLSQKVLEELEREMNKSSFWKDIDKLMDQYYPRKETVVLWKPFTHKDINDMKEEVARNMRKQI